MSESHLIRLMIVDDQELMRDGLSAILARQEGINVVATASDGADALQQLETLTPDVILMDVRMPILDGVQATIEIRRRWPQIQILMLTTFDDDGAIIEALRAGAVGYILKNIPAADLAAAVRLARKVVAALSPIAQNAVQAPTAALAGLTEREREVLALVASGANNREIAERLIISEGTVKSHISSILGQLGLRDRTQIAVFVHQQGKSPP
jgi:DNA-binding NarL/FixJ family response regulator